MRGRMMPPPGMPRPDDTTYDTVASHLEDALDRAAAARPNPGRTETFRRLTRVEYHAIRDILAIDVDVSSLLPKDDASHGFDNVSNGELSPTLLERYLAAAQKVSRAAVGGALPSPASHVVVLPADLTQEDHLEGLPFGTRGGTTSKGWTPLKITEGVQRGMNIVSSPPTAAVGGELTMFMPRWTPSVILSGVHPLLLGRFHTSIRAPFSAR